MTSSLRHALILLAVTILGGSAAEAAQVQTWWHPNAERNDSTDVAPGNVRQSTVYGVRVVTADAPDALHNSFVYMSLPRSGRAKEGYTENDGAEFSAQARMTMSWSSFLYDADAWVYVELLQGPALRSVNEVTIRPTTLNFQKELVNDRTIRIRVPYAAAGYRFSVEFDSQLMTSYVDAAGALTTEPRGNRAVHTEPRNGLMIFSEPFPTGNDVGRLTPDPSVDSIYYPTEGQLPDLHDVTANAIYFRPGTYYMGGSTHANLPPHVRWLYLAPGAYVKGAFQFHAVETDIAEIRVSGFGVLSGEQYVYEADRENGYRHRPPDKLDCHGTCVKMLEFDAGPRHRHLRVHGITVANAPYHAFVVHGDQRTFRVDASNGKHLGGWYWQTDGIELSPSGIMVDMFFHLNDDVLKIYGSFGEISDIVVWKLENGPVIQFGWIPRNLQNVHVTDVNVIHNRMHRDSHNSCLVNSAKNFADPGSNSLADPQTLVSGVLLVNIRSEGMNLCAMRLYALSSWENIRIDNLWIERWNELDPAAQASRFQALTGIDGQRVFIGNEARDRNGLALVGYVVAGERITKAADNWQSDRPGRLDFDPALWENWDAR